MAEEWGHSGGYMQPAQTMPGGMMSPGVGGAQWDGQVPPSNPGAAWNGHTAPQTGGSMPFSGDGNPSFGSNSSQGSLIAMEMRRLFLDLQHPEDQRCFRASELLSNCSDVDAAACIQVILMKLVNFPSAHPLGIHALGELMRNQPAALIHNIGPNQIYDLLSPSVDDGPAGALLHELLCRKAQEGRSVVQEATKIKKWLLRRSKTHDLRRVQSSQLRSWFSRIWLDVPSTMPDRHLVTQCCGRWIGDPQTPPAQKMPCLLLLRNELEMREWPERDAWLVSLLLEQVCRDPVSHSHDLQQLLWLLNDAPCVTVLRPLLSGLAEDRSRLVTLWVCLCLWVPQEAPEGITPRSPHPIHAFLRCLLVAFSQFAHANELCCTCLMSLAAIAAAGGGVWTSTAAAAAELLLVLHRDGPLLPGDVWLPMTPILQPLSQQFEAIAQLLARFSEVMGETPTLMSPNESMFGSTPYAPQQGFSDMDMVPVIQANFASPHTTWGVKGGQSSQTHLLQTNTTVDGNPQATGAHAYYPVPQNGAPAVVQTSAYCQPSSTFSTQQSWGHSQAVEPPPEPGKESYPLGPPKVGLQNINNTCYMNTIIQSLFMTNAFVHDIYNFKLRLKKNASKVDKEDHDMGKKIVKMMQRHLAKMFLTRHPHTDIADLLKVFPEGYRNGEQQDVTECIRLVFDRLGGHEQALVRDTFAGELKENTKCLVCGNIQSRPEIFSDLVLCVPSEEAVRSSGIIPTCQMLLNQRLQFELMTNDNLLHCGRCQKNTKTGKWAEITSPPRHLCICLNRFTYNVQKQDFAKEKTPIKIDGTLQIGPFSYELYMVIVHTGKDATSGHYYAIGCRAEMSEFERKSCQRQWWYMNDSQLQPADMTILSGVSDQIDDNPYVLFYRCTQAPPTPQVRIAKALADDVLKEDAQISFS